MTSTNVGNQLNRLIYAARTALFEQGELFELTYGAFNIAVIALERNTEDPIEITYPVGLAPDKSAILSNRTYGKNTLIDRYRMLTYRLLPVNSIIKLVTVVEALFSDLVRLVVVNFPHKLGSKGKISLQLVLEAQSIDEIHLRATDSLLNELS